MMLVWCGAKDVRCDAGVVWCGASVVRVWCGASVV